jgi:hypothetical protein
MARRIVVEVGWWHCCLENCWECCSSLELARWGVLFSGARWSQRVSWSGWFPLKSSPTCSYRWLHYDIQNVPELCVLTGPCHLGNWLTELNSKSKSKLLYDWQSVCLGIEYPCGTCDQILFPVGILLSEICGLVSIGRPLWQEDGPLQCNHSIVWVTQNLKPCFTVSSETPPTWRARFPYLYPPGTGWPSYTLGHWVKLNWSIFPYISVDVLWQTQV